MTPANVITDTFTELRSHLASLPSWTPEVAQILQRAQEQIMGNLAVYEFANDGKRPRFVPLKSYRKWEIEADHSCPDIGSTWRAFAPDYDPELHRAGTYVTAPYYEALLSEIDAAIEEEAGL